MAVSVRKPVLYAFGVVLCAGIIGGIWLWYRTHCVLITNCLLYTSDAADE